MNAPVFQPDLQAIVAELARRQPPSPVMTDPLHLILWDNIGYLIDDDRRTVLFDEFERRVGLTPQQIEAADGDILLDIASRGGMHPPTRVQRWRDIAHITLVRAQGDLGRAIGALPIAKARGLLKTYPTIGDPGADRILLFSGVAPLPSLDSNGVRALARLGVLVEQRDYAASYRAATQALVRLGQSDRDWLVTAYVTLRDLGKTLCKRAAPNCLACPLDPVCAHAVVGAP